MNEGFFLKLLDFHDVDDLGFAAASGRLDVSKLPTRYYPSELGPLLELIHLVDCGRVPNELIDKQFSFNGATEMVRAFKGANASWMCSDKSRMGVLRAARGDEDGYEQLTAFFMSAKKAAKEISGLSDKVAGQLVGAFGELESNIHEHSKYPETGVLAFRAMRGVFEFVGADRGIGALASLQTCPTYAGLKDHGKALQLVLTEGTSRFGPEAKRGYGFRPLFLGLINLEAYLRFRSGDHALILDGTSPTLAHARLIQKTFLDGLFVSIRVTI